MGWLFNALFKYPACVFRQGDFTFATSRTSTTVLALVARGGYQPDHLSRDQRTWPCP